MQKSEDLEIQPEIEQPGLSRLREAVANASQRLPGRATLVQDGLAGVNSTIGSAPDAMANAILAGVNPLYGLYAAMIGPAVGALFSSTQLMTVSSTSAAALAANQSLTGLTGDARDRALFLMVVLIGVFQIVLGVLRAGQLTRFVSYSVMTGFLAGVAMLMVLSQFPTVTGIEASGSSPLVRTKNSLHSIGFPSQRFAILSRISPLAGVSGISTRFDPSKSLSASVISSRSGTSRVQTVSPGNGAISGRPCG